MAGTELAKAYVQIVPSAKGISGSIKSVLAPEATSAGTAAGESIASNLAGKLKAALAAAGIGAAIKASLSAGGAIQQSFGGLDTLYAGAEDTMKSYAQTAYKVGFSANEYAENATSFGAALKNAFGGDVKKAAESANMAITDIADNSSKFGTDMQSLTVAYQGFSKQNYTMLDNLKLGYGGTKKEMERLLADAEKISGKKYNIDNLGDVYEAIHLIQDELGVTGNAAKEADKTFTGSFASMKAAATNLLASLSAEEMDVKPQMSALVQTASNFFFGNFVPMIGRIAASIPEALKTLFSTAVPEIKKHASAALESVKSTIPGILTAIGSYFSGDGFNTMVNNAVAIVNGFVDGIAKNAPAIISKGGEFISNLVTGIGNAMPSLISGASSIVQHIVTGILQNIPNLVSTGFNVVKSIASAISSNLPVLASEGLNIINTIVDGVKSNIAPQIPQFISSGKEFIGGLITGFTEGVPTFLENVLPMLESLTGSIRENAGQFIDAGLEMIVQLAQGLLNGLPALIEYVPSIVSNIAGIINDNVPSVLQAGWNIIVAIGQGVINAVPALISNFPAIIGAIIDVWSAVNWISLGSNLITMIKNGVMGLFTAVPQTVKSIGENAARFFKGINWSSVGTAAINFIKSGISGLASAIPNALRSIGTTAMSAFKSISWSSVGSNIISGIVSGVTGAAGALFGALKNLASSALSAAKNALGIKSPSRIFKNQVGTQIIAGWANGITENRNMVIDAITGIAEDSYKLQSRDINGFIMDDKSGRVSGANNRVVELLETIAGKDTSLVIGNKEFKRTLDDFGVAYV
ncbi:MAG: hypothetical protein MJ117_00295 [Lachnospiraceae bacterium]|nr:hypothetical protein [Lachnospiraceae bacterium]